MNIQKHIFWNQHKNSCSVLVWITVIAYFTEIHTRHYLTHILLNPKDKSVVSVHYHHDHCVVSVH